jgi:hypothetical protein
MGVLLGATVSLLAGDGQWTSEGLQGKAVYSLAIGKPPRTLFAGSPYGFFRSTEAGAWTAILDSSSNVTVVAVDPSDPAVLYAGGSGLFKTADSGDHFQTLAGLSLLSVEAIAIDPAQTSTLYVGSGYTYDDSTVSVGAVHKSTDGGMSWSALNTTSLVDGIAALVLDPRRPGTVYAGASVYYDYPGYPPAPATEKRAVIGTVDGGARWSALLDGSGLGIVDVPALAVDPQTGTVYAATSDSVFRGSSGTTWTRAQIGLGLVVGGVNAVVVDPATPTTLYAGTSLAGVFQSLDGGSTWSPMNDGLFDDETYGNSGIWVHALVLDPADGVLRAGTENGIFAIRPNVPSAPCTPAAEHLCLLGGRYRATVMAQIPDWRRDFRVARGTVVQQGDRFGSISFPSFTGDASFPEVVVKIVEPSSDRGVWVFYGGMTDLPYILSVTDTTTGRMETYTNLQNRLCGGADTAAFFEEPGPWDYGRSASAASRTRSENGALSLLGDRFSVRLSAFSSRHNRTELGVAVPGTDRYGYFSLPGFTGDPAFPEVYVKMVDFTAVSGNFWFFHTGMTSLPYTLTVTDTVTGAVRTYENPGDFCAGADVGAFARSGS